MKIFIAGATGALGVPVVRRLVADGHAVTGLTRSERKRSTLQRLGAEAVVGDVLDAESVRRTIGEVKPAVVLSLLTRLPKRGPMLGRDLQPNARVHRNGTTNLVRAAKEAGVEKLIAESVIFRYGYGDVGTLRTESDPPAASAPSPATQIALDAIRVLEDTVLGFGGIVLRYGLFYGPGAGHIEFMTKMLRRRLLPVIDTDQGLLSWIHLDDAGAATVAAIERGRAGQIYNIGDDEPISLGDFMRELASAVTAPEPRTVPLRLAKTTAPYAALMATTTLTMSNAKAKAELGWTPRYASVREGLRTIRDSERVGEA